jgi:hypothetical protein
MAVDRNGKSKAGDSLERAAPPFRRLPMVLRLPVHEPSRVGAVDASRCTNKALRYDAFEPEPTQPLRQCLL